MLLVCLKAITLVAYPSHSGAGSLSADQHEHRYIRIQDSKPQGHWVIVDWLQW
jgi:hypothetical protein